MMSRLREIRKSRGLTLAEVAALCTPPTTAVTIGRL
ncbi:XRE family transcriptional regulator, partial [Citrobacter sp. AAK_AS5]